MANFVSYANATELMTEIGNKFRALNSAYVPRGTSTFANLPTTLTKTMGGYVYNVTDDFTTTALFVEGAGKKYSAGTNVVIIDNGTTSYSAVTPEGQVGEPSLSNQREMLSTTEESRPFRSMSS